MESPQDAADADWPTATGDSRTLCVDTDAYQCRFKDWRDCCQESWDEPYENSPVPGPLTVLKFCWMTYRHGGDILRWFDNFCATHGITPQDRVHHEVNTIVLAIYHGATFDQVNLGGLVSYEILMRRLQAICQAYERGRQGKPNFGAADLFTELDEGAGGVVPALKEFVVQKARHRNALETAATRLSSGGGARDSDTAAAASGDGRDGDDGGSAPAAAARGAGAKGRGKGRSRGTRTRAPAPPQK